MSSRSSTRHRRTPSISPTNARALRVNNGAAMNFSFFASMGLVLWFGGQKVIAGEITVGTPRRVPHLHDHPPDAGPPARPDGQLLCPRLDLRQARVRSPRSAARRRRQARRQADRAHRGHARLRQRLVRLSRRPGPRGPDEHQLYRQAREPIPRFYESASSCSRPRGSGAATCARGATAAASTRCCAAGCACSSATSSPSRSPGHVPRRPRRLRDVPELRRGRPPLRARAARHPGGAAQARRALRDDRAGAPLRAAPVRDRRPLRPRPDAGRDVQAAQRLRARRPRPALALGRRRARRRGRRRERLGREPGHRRGHRPRRRRRGRRAVRHRARTPSCSARATSGSSTSCSGRTGSRWRRSTSSTRSSSRPSVPTRTSRSCWPAPRPTARSRWAPAAAGDLPTAP